MSALDLRSIGSALWAFAWAGPLVAGVIGLIVHAPGADWSGAYWPLLILGAPMVLSWIFLLGVLVALAVGTFAHLTRGWIATPWQVVRYLGFAAIGLVMTQLSVDHGINVVGRRDPTLSNSPLPAAIGAISAMLTARWAQRRGLI